MPCKPVIFSLSHLHTLKAFFFCSFNDPDMLDLYNITWHFAENYCTDKTGKSLEIHHLPIRLVGQWYELENFPMLCGITIAAEKVSRNLALAA